MRIAKFIKGLFMLGAIVLICALAANAASNASGRQGAAASPGMGQNGVAGAGNTPKDFTQDAPGETKIGGSAGAAQEASGGKSGVMPEQPGDAAGAPQGASDGGASGVMPMFSVVLPLSEVADTRYLELINADHPIAGYPLSSLIVAAWPDIAVSTTDLTIHKTALDAVRGLLTAAKKVYDETFYLGSGYRDFDKQKKVYDEASDKAYAQPPGHSEHHTGLAADIFIIGVGQYDMGRAAEAQWLAENAWQYGLLLRYTEGKRNITGVAGEPWHFRYIGKIHAWYCHNYGLCYEEYILFLKESGGYEAVLDGISYAVSYQIPVNGSIYVPESGSYEVSGDNTGGYIITLYRNEA